MSGRLTRVNIWLLVYPLRRYKVDCLEGITCRGDGCLWKNVRAIRGKFWVDSETGVRFGRGFRFFLKEKV
jgi:hypothetical protein